MLSIDPAIPKKLRVKWAVCGPGMPKIHRNKSVDPGVELSGTLTTAAVDYVGHTGLVPMAATVHGDVFITANTRCRELGWVTALGPPGR